MIEALIGLLAGIVLCVVFPSVPAAIMRAVSKLRKGGGSGEEARKGGGSGEE